MNEAIQTRSYRPETDKAFIYSTWLKNYKYSSYFAKRIKPAIFFAGHHSILDHLLAKPTIKVLIASSRDNADDIYGYVAYEPKQDDKNVVHFIFVKDAFRNMGVARTLFEIAKLKLETLSITHWTFPVDEFIRKYPMITYNPYEL